MEADTYDRWAAQWASKAHAARPTIFFVLSGVMLLLGITALATAGMHMLYTVALALLAFVQGQVAVVTRAMHRHVPRETLDEMARKPTRATDAAE